MQRLKPLIARVLQVEEGRITDETSPANLETWDSFNALMLVSELESEFKVQFTMDEVRSVTCVRDIKESLRKHGVDPDEDG